jgi:hypothetical protein
MLIRISYRFSQIYPKGDNLASSASTFYVLFSSLRPTNSSLTFVKISHLYLNRKVSLLVGFIQIIWLLSTITLKLVGHILSSVHSKTWNSVPLAPAYTMPFNASMDWKLIAINKVKFVCFALKLTLNVLKGLLSASPCLTLMDRNCWNWSKS